ncbi:MAG: flavodoxin family protein [Clostridiales bacterium]|nr:flavodoxin family protein [Clostridiales bacterium]
MNILVLNGSPRPNGNTVAMINAFADGAKKVGNDVTVIDVCKKKIAGCLGCEYCHTKGNGDCVQKDDMTEVYLALEKAEMLVLASPIYYWGFTGQLQSAINRMYAVGKPKMLKKSALILSSESPDVYEGAIYGYKNSFPIYMGLEDMGIFTANGDQNKSEEKLSELRAFGETLK